MAETRLFTQRELILLTQTHDDIQVGVHAVKHKLERGWHLRIPYQDKKNQAIQHMTLVTARGNIRTFKNLDTAVDYIQAHCSHIQAIGVYLTEPTETPSPKRTIRTERASKATPAKSKNGEVKKKPSPRAPRKKFKSK